MYSFFVSKKRKTSVRSKAEDQFIKSVGRAITARAAKRGVSIERLAYEGGISKGYAYDLIQGKGNPSLLILFRIANALDIPTSDLLLK